MFTNSESGSTQTETPSQFTELRPSHQAKFIAEIQRQVTKAKPMQERRQGKLNARKISTDQVSEMLELNIKALANYLHRRFGNFLDTFGQLMLADTLSKLASVHEDYVKPDFVIDEIWADAFKEQLMEVMTERSISGFEEISSAVKQARLDQIRRLADDCVASGGDPACVPWMDWSRVYKETFRLLDIGERNNSDTDKDYLKLLQRLVSRGLLRRGRPSCKLNDLIGLEHQFPNFSEVIQFVAQQLALADLRHDGVFAMTPVLLVGPAGVGKTHFVLALAELLGSHFEIVAMSSQTCGFGLAGLERGWSSGRPGTVFDCLLNNDSLSPIIVLDEIDKANSDARSDPLGPLYGLLEPRSAKQFTDEYVQIPMDASRILWLATANSIDTIPEPLLSRFRVFQVAPPSNEELLLLAETIFQQLTHGIKTQSNAIPDTWLNKLHGSTLREIRVAIQEALGKAALRACQHGHNEVVLTADDMVPQKITSRHSIGFVGRSAFAP